MEITKLEHAALIISQGKSKLIIDPGAFTKLPKDLRNVAAIVVTEEHGDHFDFDNIKKILDQSPKAEIFSVQAVAGKLDAQGLKIDAVSGQEKRTAGGFVLSFAEADHAPVYRSSPGRVMTVKVNEFLYYPSDSFETTAGAVEVLALPTSGPWHKLWEAIDFVNSVKSKAILPTHNGLYNAIGNKVSNHSLRAFVADKAREFVFLEVGERHVF